jgi:hypothetical protein
VKPKQKERARRDIALHWDIPVASRSLNEQLALSKVRHCLMVH